MSLSEALAELRHQVLSGKVPQYDEAMQTYGGVDLRILSSVGLDRVLSLYPLPREAPSCPPPPSLQREVGVPSRSWWSLGGRFVHDLLQAKQARTRAKWRR